jgi:high-affinity K+ transport system ATPase subunit B
VGIIIFFEKKLAILSNVIYNTFVVHGWIPEWPKGADCKSVGTAFEGSNPSPSSEFSSYIFEM